MTDNDRFFLNKNFCQVQIYAWYITYYQNGMTEWQIFFQKKFFSLSIHYIILFIVHSFYLSPVAPKERGSLLACEEVTIRISSNVYLSSAELNEFLSHKSCQAPAKYLIKQIWDKKRGDVYIKGYILLKVELNNIVSR